MTTMCIAAANYIIDRTNQYNENHSFQDRILLTGKRLQKMLFFCDVEYMLQHEGKSMFSDEYYAWPSGPVIPSVYYNYMHFQNGTMRPVEEGQHSPLSPEMKTTIDSVFSKTCTLDTFDLVELSHVKNGPWAQVYKDEDPKHEERIPKELIYGYYKSKGLVLGNSES